MAKQCASQVSRCKARGYAMLMALLAVALLALASAVAVHNASLDAQREREADLLFAGAEFREALRRYYAASRETAKQYPQRLEDLLDDRRGPTTLRHLRRLYPDPMTGRVDWTLSLHGGRIVGVSSSSQRAPLKRAYFDAEDAAFSTAVTYAEWKFAAAAGGSTGSIKSP